MPARTASTTKNQVTNTIASGWSGSTPSLPGQAASSTSAFSAGVQIERKRSLLADRVRLAAARRFQRTAQGSRDPVAVALLRQEDKAEGEILIEAVSPLPLKEPTPEQRAFADALCRKIASIRPSVRLFQR